MNENFKKLISTEQSNWLRDAERRKRWLSKLTLKPRIKYYRLKRVFLIFKKRILYEK